MQHTTAEPEVLYFCACAGREMREGLSPAGAESNDGFGQNRVSTEHIASLHLCFKSLD